MSDDEKFIRIVVYAVEGIGARLGLCGSKVYELLVDKSDILYSRLVDETEGTVVETGLQSLREEGLV